MSPHTPIIGKIQKLLTTAADSGATPAEANTAMKIAQRLMAEYRITEREIAEHAQGLARAAGEVTAKDMQTARMGSWRTRQDGWLGMAVADICGCRVFYNRGASPMNPWKMEKILVSIGLPADIAVAAELFAWLQVKMRTEVKTWCKARGIKISSISGRSFADGFSIGLLDRAKVAKAERMKSTDEITLPARATGGTALVLVLGDAEQKHEAALALRAKQMGVGKGRSSRSVNTDHSARAEGRARSSSVNLSRDVIK